MRWVMLAAMVVGCGGPEECPAGTSRAVLHYFTPADAGPDYPKPQGICLKQCASDSDCLTGERCSVLCWPTD